VVRLFSLSASLSLSLSLTISSRSLFPQAHETHETFKLTGEQKSTTITFTHNMVRILQAYVDPSELQNHATADQIPIHIVPRLIRKLGNVVGPQHDPSWMQVIGGYAPCMHVRR